MTTQQFGAHDTLPAQPDMLQEVPIQYGHWRWRELRSQFGQVRSEPQPGSTLTLQHVHNEDEPPQQWY